MINFFDLTPDNLQDYVDEARAYKGLWFFQHIPKTAGSSLVADFYDNVRPYRGVEFDYTVPPGEVFTEYRRSMAEKLLEEHKTSPYKAVSGHFIRNDVDVLRDNTDTRVFTFLRHPVQRIVSEYNYCLSDMHPSRDDFEKQYPTIEHFINDQSRANLIYQFLCSYMKIPVPFEDAISEVLSRDIFYFGIQEHYELSYRILSTMLWRTALPSQRQERKMSDKNTQLTYDKYRDMIVENNRRDVFIYEKVEAVMLGIANKAEELFEPIPAAKNSSFKPSFSFSGK